MKNTSKIIIVIVVALVFIGAGVWIGLRLGNNSSGGNGTALSPYSAVYLSTGDVYFGKLSWFPSPHLEDAWYLDRTTDASGNTVVNVYPFNKVIWGPSDTIYFNSQQIILWTPLAANSGVVQVLDNPAAATSPSSPASGVAPQSPATPATPAPTGTSSTSSTDIPVSTTSTVHTK